MGYLEALHEAHKARLRRMGGAAADSRPGPKQQSWGKGPPPASDAQLIANLRVEIERLRAENARLLAQPGRDPKVPRRPTIVEIKALVASTYGVSTDDLDTVSREDKYLLPRMIAIHLARRLTVQTLAEIALRFGKRGHTTAMNAHRRVLERRNQDSAFNAELRALERQLTARRPTGR